MTLMFERPEDTNRYDVIRNGKCLFQTESLSVCRSTCKGAAIIIASGPSVKNFPLERYSHIPMFAVNARWPLSKRQACAHTFMSVTTLIMVTRKAKWLSMQ